MPGKYLEYIKAGRYVVPVELTFLPAKLGEEVTSKWVERRHWKEVKALLKPAVELVSKYNEGITERVTKSHHVAFGHEIALGYLIQPNKDKSPFLAVLDPKKNCWTEDEEEMEVDENSGLGDFGGRHKSFMPTKSFVKVCILKKTASQAEDGKKLRKELGVKLDDVRNYFSSGSESALTAWNSSMVGGSSSSPQKQHKPKMKRKVGKKASHRSRKEKEFSSSEESLMDLPPPGTRDLTPSPQRFLRVTENVLPERDRVEAIELDDDSLLDNIIPDTEIFSDSVEDVFSSSSLFRNWIEDDDEDFDEELPDIEETSSNPVKKKKSGSRRKTGMDKSPVKSTSGLPDIDDPNKRSKNKKKRNVAIVEPMKPSAQISPTNEESGAAGTERRKKTRGLASPTIERLLNSRSRQSNPAIEIVSEDGEIPLSDSHSSASKQSKKRQRRTKKQVNTTFSDRLTPSPFPESPPREADDGHLASGESDSSDSDVEMPVLTKMVPSPNNESFLFISPGSPPDTIPPLEPQAELPSYSSIVRRPQRPRRSPSPDIVEQCSFSSTLIHRKRVRAAASDSDDITSESAYRKTPFRRKKTRKRSLAEADDQRFGSNELEVPGDSSDDLHSMATQTILPLPSPRFEEEGTESLTHPIAREPERLPSSSPIPSTSKSFNLFSIKKERVESTDAKSDSDHVPSSEEEDDEDVLFAGQYQAIPIVTLDASPPRRNEEDDSEDELFSFTRPSVKMEPNSQSRTESPFSISALATNRSQSFEPDPVIQESSLSRQTESALSDDHEGSDTHDDDYAFNFVERSVRSQKRSGNLITPQTNPFSDPPPPESQSQSQLEEESENSVQSLSTFQLMNHPGTLQAGFGFLNKVMSKNGAPNSVLKQLRLSKSKKKSSQSEDPPSSFTNTDSDLMPPPPSVRPVSPDICSLGPEERRRSKPSRERDDEMADSDPMPGTSSGRPSSPLRLFDDLGHERGDQESDAVEPYFREYMNRRQQQTDVEYQPLGDEYDLTQSSQCMLNIVPDYAAKSRQYKKHTKNIEKLTAEQFRQCFEIVKPDLLMIFNGTETSHRNQLYCNRRHHDIRTLKSLFVNQPFNEEHGNSLNGWLYDLMVPYSGSTLKTADYVNYVMRPEAFIRIYALVNKISRETAEKEMMAGPCYDGPYLER